MNRFTDGWVGSLENWLVLGFWVCAVLFYGAVAVACAVGTRGFRK